MSNAPTVGEVKQFIEELGEPKKLLEGCRRFHEIEPRDIAYVVCSKLVWQLPGDISHILAGTRLFLQVWNAVYIQHLSREYKQSMEEDIRNAYLSCSGELTSLAQDRLDDINLTEQQKADAIRKAFHTFAKYESIGQTGASKVLHLLNPGLFMMWDTEIRKAYNKLLPDQLWMEFLEKWHNDQKKVLEKFPPFKRRQLVEESHSFISESYLRFVEICQSIAKELLHHTSEPKLWLSHLLFMKDPNFISTWGFSETLPKMIDECNFVRWRLGERI